MNVEPIELPPDCTILERRLGFAAQCAGRIGQLAACRLPGAQELATELLMDVRAYRVAEILPLNKEQLEAFRAILAPIEAQARAHESKVTGAKLMLLQGPALWAELHTRAFKTSAPGFPILIAEERAWLNAFISKLPCGECKANAVKHLRELPPDFGAYFAWSVAFHNLVNKLIGNPEFSIEEARARWGRPAVV